MSRPSLTLCLIVKNEQNNLPRLLDSVKDCFDEIHITDTGSTDGTVEIIKKYGCKLRHFEWIRDFSAARNDSISEVKTDFWAWMDADDALHNRENFILWRDNAMEFADFWLATYHYSLSAQGVPTCSFARERVFRSNLGLKWNYFVHEGVVPLPNNRQNYAISWAVNHMRGEEDIRVDRARNLAMFIGRELDPRMMFYAGKELFENGMAKDGGYWLMKAIKEPSLNEHDRVLGLQYAAYCAMQMNDTATSIALAHQGLQLSPNRAEFQVIIGDSYLKQGKLQEAIPFFEAARNSKDVAPANSKFQGAVFTSHEQYGYYPTLQLAKIYGNLQNYDQSMKEVNHALSHWPTDEMKAFHVQLQEFMKKASPETVKDTDELVISCPPNGLIPWDGELYRQGGMGGSETAAIEIAEWVHKLTGRAVKIFNNIKEPKTFNGVEYLPSSQCAEYLKANKPKAHLAWRHSQRLTDAPSFLWCHDLVTPGAENTSNYDKILCLSPFHKRYVMAMQGIPEDKIIVTRNGIDPTRFEYERVPKDPNKIVYMSSPDRGLDRAMLVLDGIVETFPDIRLHVYYGLENLYKCGLDAMGDMLKKMMKERPWVIYHGWTEQKKLAEELKDAAIWLHPANFIETNMITCVEVMASQIYGITRSLGAIPDTYKPAIDAGMGTLLDRDCVTEDDIHEWRQAVLSAYRNQAWEFVDIDPKQFAWEKVAKEFISFLGL